jgi:hypothetical protein
MPSPAMTAMFMRASFLIGVRQERFQPAAHPFPPPSPPITNHAPSLFFDASTLA